jgi:hypothetical protein
MFRLFGPDGGFTLDVLDYQFPGMAPDGCDSEWLQVKGAAECPEGKWSFTDSCLMTYELEDLATWLRELRDGAPSRELTFIEPCIRFKASASSPETIRVHFAHEASPPWIGDDKYFDDGHVLEFAVEHIDFNSLLNGIHELSKKFPPRAVPGA